MHVHILARTRMLVFTLARGKMNLARGVSPERAAVALDHWRCELALSVVDGTADGAVGALAAGL